MIDREVYQAEELDCYLETLCAGQFSQHSFNLPETEQNLVEMILGISARACPACIDLGVGSSWTAGASSANHLREGIFLKVD